MKPLKNKKTEKKRVLKNTNTNTNTNKNKNKKNKTIKRRNIKMLSPLIRFYDNDKLNIKHFKEQLKYVEPIFVDNSPNKEILNGFPASSYTTKFLEKNPDNKFALYLKSLNNREVGTDIGFSEKDAKNLKKWANKSSREKTVIFDWDGCLSTIEGIIIPNTLKMEEVYRQNGITDTDIAIYYAGGKKRFQMLKQIFQYLNKKKVRVFILTNNPTASCKIQSFSNIGPNSRDNFYKVARQIIPQINKEDILCGYDDDCVKPVTFLKNDYLRNVYFTIQYNTII